MSEPHEQPKKPDSAHKMQLAWGFVSLGLFFSGLAEVLFASESGSTIKLVVAVIPMVFGGIGAAVAGWLLFTKRA
jgi:hypothetical protein